MYCSIYISALYTTFYRGYPSIGPAHDVETVAHKLRIRFLLVKFRIASRAVRDVKMGSPSQFKIGLE